MRYLLTTGALAFMLAGAGALAQANPSISPQHPAAASSRAQVIGAGMAVQSPDLAEWAGANTAKPTAVETTHRTTRPVAHHIAKFASRLVARTTRIAKTLTRSALRFLGTPYVFGGTSRAGFDCSGYVQHVFALLGVSIPRTADAQYYAGHRTVGGMKPGDLVFFQTYEPGPSHVGIYLGDGEFVHASSSHGVMVSKLSDSYWSARYLGAKRLL